MMEQDVKIGSVGDLKVVESVASESVSGSVALPLGPLKLKISVEADLENKALLDLVIAKLPGGVMHELAAKLEAVLMPSAPPAA